jgi:hypothetical protein
MGATLQTAFGGNPQAYEAARADYPARLFKLIRARCAIGPMTRAFEIGPGTGKATRPILDVGLGSLIGVEPDARLAAYLRKELADPRLRLVEATFEAAGWCACCGPAGTGQCGGTSTRTRNGPTRSAMR